MKTKNRAGATKMSSWQPDSPGASPAALRGGARCRGRGAVGGGRPGHGLRDDGDGGGDGVDDVGVMRSTW